MSQDESSVLEIKKNSQEEGGARDERANAQGAYTAFLIVAAAGYIALLLFVFAYGLYGDTLTSGVDVACAEAAYASGKEVEAQGNYDLAILRYHQALEGRFQDSARKFDCARSIGEVLFKLGRYQEAIEAYRGLPPEAFSEPGHWTAYVSSLWYAGDLAEAEKLGKVWLAAAENPSERPKEGEGQKMQVVWAKSTLGQICEKSGRLDEALEYFDSAATLEPEGRAVILGARVLRQLGREGEASARLDEFMRRVASGSLHEDARRLRAEMKG